MSNQTTRRNVITAVAALPLFPAAALSVPVALPLLPVSAYGPGRRSRHCSLPGIHR